MESWAFVEADFLREYSIDLAADLPGMSWRRFQVLLRALSSQSVTVTRLVNSGLGRKGNERVVAGSKAAQQAFVGLFGGAPTPTS